MWRATPDHTRQITHARSHTPDHTASRRFTSPQHVWCVSERERLAGSLWLTRRARPCRAYPACTPAHKAACHQHPVVGCGPCAGRVLAPQPHLSGGPPGVAHHCPHVLHALGVRLAHHVRHLRPRVTITTNGYYSKRLLPLQHTMHVCIVLQGPDWRGHRASWGCAPVARSQLVMAARPLSRVMDALRTCTPFLRQKPSSALVGAPSAPKACLAGGPRTCTAHTHSTRTMRSVHACHFSHQASYAACPATCPCVQPRVQPRVQPCPATSSHAACQARKNGAALSSGSGCCRRRRSYCRLFLLVPCRSLHITLSTHLGFLGRLRRRHCLHHHRQAPRRALHPHRAVRQPQPLQQRRHALPATNSHVDAGTRWSATANASPNASELAAALRASSARGDWGRLLRVWRLPGPLRPGSTGEPTTALLPPAASTLHAALHGYLCIGFLR